MSVKRTTGGIRFDRTGAIRITGAVSATANLDLVKKPISPLKRVKHLCIKEGEGVYVKDAGIVTRGFNFPVAEAIFEAHAATEINVIALSSTLVVAVFLDGNDTYAKAIAGTVDAAGAITWGTAVNINAALTDSLSICKLSATSFAVAYRDNTGTTGYICLRIGSVSTTTITFGSEKELNAAASNAYTGITMPTAGYLVVVYSETFDSHGDSICIDYSGTTLGTAGTAVEFNGAASSWLSIVSHAVGKFTISFRDAGNSNKCCSIVGSHTLTGIDAYTGSVTAISSAAATYISTISPVENVVYYVYVVATFASVKAATISGVEITSVTEKTLNSSASKFTKITALSPDKVVVSYEDDGAAVDYGSYFLLAVSAANLFTTTANYIFAIGATADNGICALDGDRIVICFKDEGDSNNGKCIVGNYNEFLIDVRGEAASKRFVLWLIPYYGAVKTA
jgi:hypothetical protein